MYSTTTTQATQRLKCPVHHGKKPSVSVGFIDGRAWAKCWSRGCDQADILAALGIATSSKIFWEVQKGVTGSVAKMSAWSHPRPRPRPTFSVDYLPPVSPNAGVQYLKGIQTPSGSAIQYQRDDGQRGKHWRNDTKRRNPGVKGDGWQVRRFNPVSPSSATAICLAEGEKDAATLAAAGLIAFTAPRGAQSLAGADFTELVDLAKETGLPVLLCGDNDEPGREAMRKVRLLLRKDHVDAVETHHAAPIKGSIADLGILELQGLIRNNLSDRDPRWQKPIRNRAQYLEFRCAHRKRNIKKAGDLSGIWGLVSCGNTATCTECAAWESYLHIERCWQGKPAQMIQVSGFGEVDSTIAETVGMGKVYRGHLEDRLREKHAVRQKVKKPSSERRVFITALALGDDYRGELTMFLSSPLSDQQIVRERRRAEDAGLSFTVKNVVTREDIEDAAPKSLTVSMQRELTPEERKDLMAGKERIYIKKTVGMTDKTNTWTSSGWPTWWEPDTTYAFSDGRDLEDGEDFPTDSISAKEWKSEHNQQWDTRKSLIENLWQREEDALFNSQLWMTPCHGLSMETLQAIAEGGDIPALIEEVGDYKGPTALLVDVANWLHPPKESGRKEWRKAFRPVLDAAGWREK